MMERTRMPIITIEITPQDYVKKAEITMVFTNELSRITGIPKGPIVVLFHEVSAENSALAGEMLLDKFKRERAK
jgi:phenylpyruvate tautomerase PptA (4-oxalocrotonate tautomerase family)